MDNSVISRLLSSSVNEGEFIYTYRKKVFTFRLHKKVAKPNYNSFFFAENIEVGSARNALDLGTGSGFFALLMAGTSEAVVTAIDSNPFAVDLARVNAQLNGLESKIKVELGDLFITSEQEKFDLIVCNPPFTPLPPVLIDELRKTDQLLYSNSFGGIDGRDIIDRVIAQSRTHLNTNGRLMLIHPDYVNVNRTFHKFEQAGFEPKIVCQRQFPLGTLGTLQKPYIEFSLGFRFIIGPDGDPYQLVSIIEGTLR